MCWHAGGKPQPLLRTFSRKNVPTVCWASCWGMGHTHISSEHMYRHECSLLMLCNGRLSKMGGGSFCNAVIFSSVNSKATWNLLKVVPSISSSAPKRVLCPAVVSKFVEDVIQLCSGSLPHYHLQNASEHPDFQEFVGKQVLFFGVSLISWGNS